MIFLRKLTIEQMPAFVTGLYFASMNEDKFAEDIGEFFDCITY